MVWYDPNRPNNNSYSWVDNGQGGVNYFADNGQFKRPIAREEFQQGSNQDPGSIENWVQQQYRNNAGPSTPTGQGNEVPLGGDTSGGSGGGGSGGGDNAGSNADIAYYDDTSSQLQRQLQSALTALDQGQQSINTDYNTKVSGANLDRSRAVEDFNAQGVATDKAREAALGGVNSNARTLSNSLRRMIGMASGTGSSAYQTEAPGAVANLASQNRTGVLNNFGANKEKLDTASSRASADFAQLLDQLSQKKNDAFSNLESGIYGQQNDINAQLADVARKKAVAQGGGYAQAKAASSPYTSAISDRQNAIDGLFAKYAAPFKDIAPVNVQTPDLAAYTYDKYGLGGGSQQAGQTQSPYDLLLQKKKQEQLA